jgi:hypothetical protein
VLGTPLALRSQEFQIDRIGHRLTPIGDPQIDAYYALVLQVQGRSSHDFWFWRSPTVKVRMGILQPI